MIDRDATQAGLSASIAAAVPTVTTIFRAEDAGLETLEDIINVRGLPYAVIWMDLKTTGEWGLVNRVEAGMARIFLFFADDNTAADVDAALLLLQRELHTNFNSLDVGQVLHWPSATMTPDLSPVAFFLTTQRPFRVGLVTAEMVLGETP